MLPDPKSGRLLRMGLGQGFNTSRMNRTTSTRGVKILYDALEETHDSAVREEQIETRKAQYSDIDNIST